MVEKLEKIISQSQNIVFFGGAGVSTESGIPDFRSVDGLYHQKYDYPPETILSHTFWEERPEEFYRFYRDKLIVKGAKPNAAHLRLAKLEREGRLKAVITQNIDGLLARRHENKKLLRAGKHPKGPAKHTREQDEAFIAMLEVVLKSICL